MVTIESSTASPIEISSSRRVWARPWWAACSPISLPTSVGESPSGTRASSVRPRSGASSRADDRVEGAVLEHAEPASAVLDDGQRNPERNCLYAAHRAAVGDDEHASAGMPVRNPPQRLQHPLLVCLGRLAHELDTVPLDRGQPLPGSPVLLA